MHDMANVNHTPSSTEARHYLVHASTTVMAGVGCPGQSASTRERKALGRHDGPGVAGEVYGDCRTTCSRHEDSLNHVLMTPPVIQPLCASCNQIKGDLDNSIRLSKWPHGRFHGGIVADSDWFIVPY